MADIPAVIGRFLEMMFKKGSIRKATKLGTYLYETERAQRARAMQTIINGIAEACRAYGEQHRTDGIRRTAEVLCARGLELGDCTLLNAVWSSPPFYRITAYESVRIDLLQETFRYIGATWDRTRSFCSAVFPDYADQLAQPMAGGRNATIGFFEKNRPLVTAIIQESAFAAAHPDFFFNAWFEHLIRHTGRGDATVDQWAELAWTSLTTHSTKLNVVTQSRLEKRLRESGLTLDNYGMLSFDPHKPQAVIPDDLEKDVIAFVQHVADRPERAATMLASWMQENRSHILGELKSKRQDILNADYGVRQYGRDWVEARTSALLQALGIESIAFVPVGASWPDMDVRFTVRRLGYVVCAYRGSLVDLNLTVPDGLLDWYAETEKEAWLVVLEYAVITALHAIVVRREFSSYGDVDSHGSQTAWHRVRSIRPHFPRLPEGKKMSEEARRRCRERGFVPRPGRTFNKGYDSETAADAASTRPIVKLNDDLSIL